MPPGAVIVYISRTMKMPTVVVAGAINFATAQLDKSGDQQ